MAQNVAAVDIVQVNVSIIEAPASSTLQQSGAFISQGGTTLANGTLQQIPTLASLTSILAPAKTLASLTWASSLVTATTSAPHGWTNGDVVNATISGATPTGYNYSGPITITGLSTFTYPLASDPGSETAPGTVVLASVAELNAMATTYFAGLNQVAPYVLELGEGTPVEGVAALTTWLTNNPSTMYAFLVPREWDAVSQFEALVNTYTAPNSKLYFFTTMVTGDITAAGNTYTTPYTGKKNVYGEVEAPAIPATEFSLASAFASWLSLNPSASNRLSAMQYKPAYGVTAYPVAGNSATFAELAGANVGWIATGAEGGLSTTILKQGLLQDGNQAVFWYSADWAQINFAQALANEVINGSQPGGNPLEYNQQGINRLQNRCVQVANQGVAAGLANGQVLATKLDDTTFWNNYNAGMYDGKIVINAVPFDIYTQLNPNDYAAGIYKGLTNIWIPQLGFLSLVFNLNVTDLVA